MSVRAFEEQRYQKHTPLTWRQRIVADIIKGGTALDLGCGDGLLLKELAKKGVAAVGVDISPTAVAVCKKQGLSARVCDFDGKRLPFKAKTFDSVMILDVLEHLYFPAETLTEARRIGKCLVLVAPNFTSASARLQVLFGRVPENNTTKKGHVQWITLDVLKAWLQKTDWKLEELKGNYYLQWLPVVNLVTRLLGKLFPSLFTTAFLVVAR